jgi:hypothetical protein
MAYVSLYNVVLRQCANTVLKLRQRSLALAKAGSKRDKELAGGWSLELLVTTCESSSVTPDTTWSLFIQRIVADAQKTCGPATFGAVLLTYYKLRSVLGQMETKSRKLGVKSVQGVMADPLASTLGGEAKRLYARTKASLGVAISDVARESEEEGDSPAAYREAREVSMFMRQAHRASLVDDANRAETFAIVQQVDETPLFTEEEKALFLPGDDAAIRRSLHTAQAVRNKYGEADPPEPPGTFTEEEKKLFRKGDAKAIEKSLHVAQAVRSRPQDSVKGLKEPKVVTGEPVFTGEETAVFKEGGEKSPRNPGRVPRVLESLSVITRVADLRAPNGGKSGAVSEVTDPGSLVDGAVDLPAELANAGVETSVNLSATALGDGKHKKTKQRKSHKVQMAATQKTSKPRHRRHKVKPVKRRGNRSASWGA